MDDNCYTASCYKCGTANRLQMIAHRNKSGAMVGWIFACSKCFDHLKDLNVYVGEQDRNALCPWQPIETAPMDGTKIVTWLEPNEVNAPQEARPRISSWEIKQFKNGLGDALGEPFGMWSCNESAGPMSYAPTYWVPIPEVTK